MRSQVCSISRIFGRGNIRLARRHGRSAVARGRSVVSTAAAVAPPEQISGLPEFLQSLKYDDKGLVTVIVQNIDSGELAMQAFADQAALSETLQTGLATFYSRSRHGRWCKGETSGNFIQVLSVCFDCDKDSIIYLSEPKGPSCHTGAKNCWFQTASIQDGKLQVQGEHTSTQHAPRTSLKELEHTIMMRQQEAANDPDAKPSWTAKLLSNPELLCSKIREEAGELCDTVTEGEGRERTVSEAADLLYHAMVLLQHEGVELEEVARELRRRFGVSGVEEKAARK
eukprot:jgi/Ulvmu1/1122/UM106_0039.1